MSRFVGSAYDDHGREGRWLRRVGWRRWMRAVNNCIAMASLAFALITLSACGGESSNASEEEATAAEPSERPVPTAEADPGVDLQVSVGLLNGRVVINNHSSETLENILVILNRGEGEFRHSFGSVHPNAMIHFAADVFRQSDGTRLNPEAHDVETFALYADTPRGRGHWQGSYRPR